MIDDRLLAALSDGYFHSGQELGRLLGVSRSAIWKQMKELELLGVDIYSIRGRGYRIPGGLDLLCEKQIATGCSALASSRLSTISLERIVDSTNMMAMREIHQQGVISGRLYLAEYQTAGKGRRGRTWVSPFAKNLYFSLVWRFTQGAAALEGLSLVVGLALVKTLNTLGISQVQVKWPNDLLVHSRKLAGILLEMHGDASGECQVVIGVGVNVAMPEHAEEAIGQPWTDLKRLSAGAISRNQLMSEILNHLIPELDRFSEHGFAVFRDEWQEIHAYQNQTVRLISGVKEIIGECHGVDEHGALVLSHSGIVEHFYAGEISLRQHDAS
ncbi:bifunctional biotin--[acetyl-CoA-carboxylase] ligase/biotin operon repressor BirA [Neptunomonas antarctica]|uniref:Bifunctional ligase/repressor BirA n=1 Tax=Neptunomonas antarctica TaxID=619304 RepID=A0A1N7MIV6_9GAMM|nr:bifunctional biotin--[acetyl-CoA-carboxylase] ligase/biotin operon repressor BirA [Neptunomonas antarctica]SIS86114.1 BirA family transcriptional regulator, biotin operon repressor / biotin-[acetyl-CoA-carboxylase] ligase [Neptunomonas antarctica]